MGEHYPDTVVVDGSIPSAPIELNRFGGIIAVRRGKKPQPKRQIDTVKMNGAITTATVRVVDETGEQLGVLSTKDAIATAAEKGLDLVEVSDKSDPPVCRIMDYGKHKYQASKKQHEAKKKQVVIKVKEIKMRPKTEEHDFQFKLKHARQFIEAGNKVKVTVMFRGREMAFTYMGKELLERFKADTEDICIVENEPKHEGRLMQMILAPKKSKK